MSNSQFTAKWTMHSTSLFTAEKGGYEITVKVNPSHVYWLIEKDSLFVDDGYNHSISKSELGARVQAERVLNKLLNQKINEPSSTTKIL